MTLDVSPDLKLPDEAALWTFADLAIKGAGKTYAAGDFAEEMVKRGIPIISVDPIGTWWGLRVGAEDGKPGLPVVVFGGDHKDIAIPTRIEPKSHTVQADEAKLKLLAKSILESGISAVLDTSEFSKGVQRRIAAIFLDEVYHLNKNYGVRHIFIEEADFLAPQQSSGRDDTAYSLGAVDDIVRRGGNFNLGCTLITQRSAVLNKNVLTQCNCLIVLRILHKLDKDAVATWVKSMASADEKKMAKWYDSLRELENGEAWVWHPETDLFKRIKFRKRETLHATREYFRQERWEQRNVKMADVESYIGKFKSVFEPKPKAEEKPLDTMPLSSSKGASRDGQTEGSWRAKPPVDEGRKATPVSSRQALSSPDSKVYGLVERSEPPVHSPEDAPSHVVNQMLPNIQIEQYKPNVRLGVELPEEPATILGKVCIVLKNGPAPSNRNDRWNPTLIRKRLEAHAWDTQGYEDAIEQLVRWEILAHVANYLRFDPSRVERRDRGATIPA